MRNSKTIYVLLLALLAGLLAVFFAANWVLNRTPANEQQVAVALQGLAAGTVLRPGQFQLLEWPGSTLPEGAKTRLEDLEGRVLRTPLIKGEPVLEGKLAPPGSQGGLSGLIDPGKRAITVKVNEIVGVAGFALPGNYVDVVVNTKNAREEPISKIVLERIHVLAVAQETSGDPGQPKVVEAVTLEVTPSEAERLDLARNIGTLALVLRSSTDPSDVTTSGAMRQELLGEADQAGTSRSAVARSSPPVAPATPTASRVAAPRATATPRAREAAVPRAPAARAPASPPLALPPLPPATYSPAPVLPQAYPLPGYPQPGPVPAPRPDRGSVEVIQGTERTIQSPLE